MRVGDSTSGIKRINSSISQLSDAEILDSDHLHDSKRLKHCSSTETAATRPSSGADTGATKRSNSSISQTSNAVVLDSDHLHDSKRLKRCSSTAASTNLSSGTDTSGTKRNNSSMSQSSGYRYYSRKLKHCLSTTAATRPSSVVDASCSKRVTNIHDLPGSMLVEILCRIPSYEYIARCKCVSKTWCTLMSDLSFIKRFVCLQSNDGKQLPIIHTLVNNDGWEFLNRLSLSRNPLARLFEKLMSVHHLEKVPVVVATYNDLVLCSTSRHAYDYYICNPQTCQWVTVPRPPKLYLKSPVGFICDLPYFQCMEENHVQKEQLIQFNPQYRCRIVRLITNRNREKPLISEFRVQIFSSETWEWTESTVLLPSTIDSDGFYNSEGCPCNGVLYWKGRDVLIGVDPFMVTSSSSCSTPASDDHYKCRLVEFVQPDEEINVHFYYVDRGCFQMLNYEYRTHVLSVWEVNEDDFSAEAGKYCLQQRRRVHELDWGMVDEYDNYWIYLLAFDPNNDGTLYMHIGPDTTLKGEIKMYNIVTREWSKIVEDSSFRGRYFYPLVRQCWPTPVPKLPPHCK